MGRLFGHLGHPDHVLRGVETLQRGRFCIQLVAQHDDQIAHRGGQGSCVARGVGGRVGAGFFHADFLLTFLARQASEQYNTDSQFLAQALRHVMVRPHTAHSLLGRFCLLPLKSFFM
jgi:hypothetical protein